VCRIRTNVKRDLASAWASQSKSEAERLHQKQATDTEKQVAFCACRISSGSKTETTIPNYTAKRSETSHLKPTWRKTHSKGIAEHELPLHMRRGRLKKKGSACRFGCFSFRTHKLLASPFKSRKKAQGKNSRLLVADPNADPSQRTGASQLQHEKDHEQKPMDRNQNTSKLKINW
jgi:hypothetical protein